LQARHENGAAGMAYAFLGRRIGGWVAARWGRDLAAALDVGKERIAPLARALVDTFVLDWLSAAVWPSVATLLVLLGAHAAVESIGMPREAERIVVGAVVLLALAWSAVGLATGAVVSWPHLRFWAMTGLGPVRHVRLLIFLVLREQQRRLGLGQEAGGFAARTAAAAFEALQRELRLSPDRAAYVVADHLAPLMLRHLLGRAALVLAPVVAALAYYRLALYPSLVLAGAGAGPWAMALYPLAALADWLAGTHLRAVLAGTA
jgi:hypothetical protein